MKTFHSYRLVFTPLAPIHIGTGASYEPTNYVIEDETLHEFDTGSLVDALPAREREELLGLSSKPKVPAVDRYGNQRRTRADSGPDQILECVPAFRCRAFAAQLNVQWLDGVNRPGEVPAADLRFDMGHIVQACNAFYRPILLIGGNRYRLIRVDPMEDS